jgi:hypothetical protein
MIVEQTTSQVFPFEHLKAQVQITTTIRLASPGTPGVNVAIDLPFDAFLDEQLQEIFDQFLFNAIHEGIPATDQSITEHGIQIDVTKLEIAPTSVIVQEGKLVGEILRVVEFMISSIVATLCYTISTINTPAATKGTSPKKIKKV